MTLNNIPGNIEYEFGKNNNLVLRQVNETKVSSYDISRHDEPVAEMKYADGTKVLIFKAPGIPLRDYVFDKIWIEEEKVYCISIIGEYKYINSLDFKRDEKVLYETKLDVRETVNPKEYQEIKYEVKDGLLFLYFLHNDKNKEFKFPLCFIRE